MDAKVETFAVIVRPKWQRSLHLQFKCWWVYSFAALSLSVQKLLLQLFYSLLVRLFANLRSPVCIYDLSFILETEIISCQLVTSSL